jgi:ribokinase
MGKDSMADLLIKEMTESGVSLAGLVQVNHVQTGQAIILLDENGENSIVIIGGANMQQEALLD